MKESRAWKVTPVSNSSMVEFHFRIPSCPCVCFPHLGCSGILTHGIDSWQCQSRRKDANAKDSPSCYRVYILNEKIDFLWESSSLAMANSFEKNIKGSDMMGLFSIHHSFPAQFPFNGGAAIYEWGRAPFKLTFCWGDQAPSVNTSQWLNYRVPVTPSAAWTCPVYKGQISRLRTISLCQSLSKSTLHLSHTQTSFSISLCWGWLVGLPMTVTENPT